MSHNLNCQLHVKKRQELVDNIPAKWTRVDRTVTMLSLNFAETLFCIFFPIHLSFMLLKQIELIPLFTLYNFLCKH